MAGPIVTVEDQVKGAKQFYELQRRVGRESVSGPGSFLTATTEIREWLPRFLLSVNAVSLADCPCGDFHWLSEVCLPCEYAGYDIVPEIVEANRRNHPARCFDVLNLVESGPTGADVILCRDLLVHLTYEHAEKVLANFKASGARYVLLTTFPGIQNTELAQSHTGWGWRPLDMEAAPFGLGPAVDGVREVVAGEKWERWIRAYEL